MNLFDELSIQDREKIETYIVNCNYHRPMKRSLETVLKRWSDNKEFLYNLFGQQLIVEKPIQFTKTTKNMIAEFEKALFNPDNADSLNVYQDLCRYLSTHAYICRDGKRICNLANNGGIEFNWSFSENDLFTSSRYLVTNELSFDNNKSTAKYLTNDISIEVVLSNGKVIPVQKGMKTMKLFSKIAKDAEISEEKFEKFRIFQSMITNQKEVSGTLCLSIHPLDYMTMSDNNNSWSSCMSWIKLGCYCTGTIEMLNSPCVIVAYVRDDKNAELNGISWNNKKWRQLFIVDKDFACGIKGYPYSNHSLEDECLKMIRDCAINSKMVNYGEEIGYIFLDDDFECEWPKGKDIALRLNPMTEYMYNDFGTGVYHHCILNFDNVEESMHHYDTTVYDLKNSFNYDYNYSGAAQCMLCGDLISCDYDDANILSCNECAGRYYCDKCGRRLYEDDCDTIIINGNYYCEECVEYSRYTSFYTGQQLNSLEHKRDCCLAVFLDNNKQSLTWMSSVKYIYSSLEMEGSPKDYIEGNKFGNIELFKKDAEFIESFEKIGETNRFRINIDELTALGREHFDFY